jgi:hypothetical protein
VPFDHTDTYPADPRAVLAVLTDEDFLREAAEAVGGRVRDVAVERVDGVVTTTVQLVAPTLGIPAVFARFVGSEVPVTDRRTWRLDGGPPLHGALDVSARIMGRTAGLRGDRTLAADPAGTRSSVTGEARVDAPVVGRQAESAVRELAFVVLRREGEVLRRRLG